MKKAIKLFLILGLILLVVGCSKTDPVKPPIQGETNLPNHEQVLQDIKKLIETDVPVKLPQELPLSEKDYLTAVVKSEKNGYSVDFYKNSEPMELNSEDITKDKSTAIQIAFLEVERKASIELANEEISFQDYSSLGGEKINLGYNVTGFQDAGAGSVFISWNKGPWAIVTRTLTAESQKGVDLATEVVKYLEENSLPVPDQHGNIHLDTEKNGNLSKWQDKDVVYVLTQIKEPLDMLKFIASFK